MGKHLILSLLQLYFVLVASSQGVDFKKAKDWAEIINKAKKENKLIFVDCYTTWCGPCKKMDKTTFQDSEVAKFMNANFVSHKLQMDVTKNDDEYTKSWANTAVEWQQKYQINSYPTYLIFDSNGNPIDRASSYQEADQFLKTMSAIKNNKNGYYSEIKGFKQGKRDSLFVSNLLNKCLKFKDYKTFHTILNEVFDGSEKWLQENNLKILFESKPVFQSKIYNFLVENIATISESRKMKITLERTLYESINNALIIPNIKFKNSPNWQGVTDSLEKYLPMYKEPYLFKAKVLYAVKLGDTMIMQNILMEYNKPNTSQWLDFAKNEFAEKLVQSNNKAHLEFAKTMEQTKSFGPSQLRMAKIYYKLGNKDEAINIIENEIKNAKAWRQPQLYIQLLNEELEKIKNNTW